MPKPLEGLLVVTLEQAVAAPLASRKCADAGARVVKLERPEGDFARGYDKAVHGQSSFFLWLNRGKESVVADLGRAEDKRLLEGLLARADVFVQNLKPGALARLGFPVEELRRRFPRLVVCSISGYGEEGPMAGRKAYDLLIQAESGLASVTGGPEAPGRIGVSAVDITTGMTAYEAILEALIRRGRTGEGADIRVSMFATMADWMAVPLMHGEYGSPPKRIGLSHPLVSPYGVFTCGDGKPILIAIQNEREWAVLCRDVLGRPDMITDPRFATNVARVANRAETDGVVAAFLGASSIEEAARRLDAADIAYGRVSEVMDVLAHPHFRQIEVATPEGPARMPSPGASTDGEPLAPGPVPRLGEHTEAVRREVLG
jgi:itaconate CoA-transferase